MDNLNCSGIYKIVNKLNDKYYVGSSQNIKTRIRKHFELLKRNVHHGIYLQNSYNLYGKNSFDVFLLEECSIDELIITEQKYLDSIVDWKMVYNMNRIASGGGCDLSNHPNQQQIRENMSKSNIGKHTKPFFINDVRYEKLQDAADEFNVDIKAISSKLKNWKNKDWYYENMPKVGEYDQLKHNVYFYNQKNKKKHTCFCGVEITKDSKFCGDCIKIRRINYIYLNPVIINNVEYDNPKIASKMLKIEYATLIYRINTNTLTYKDYYYKDKPKNISKLLTNKDINQKISIKNKGNSYAKTYKPFIVDGVKYPTLGEASKKLKMGKQLIWDRLKSKNFNNYHYI